MPYAIVFAAGLAVGVFGTLFAGSKEIVVSTRKAEEIAGSTFKKFSSK